MLIFRAIKIAIQISTVFLQDVTGSVPGTAVFNCERSPRSERAYQQSLCSVASSYLNKGQEFCFGEQAVKDSERLELDWLLKCNVEELIALVRPMSAKNCEQIVRAILDRIGGPTFEQLLTRIIGTMVPRDGRGPPTNSDEYYFAIRDLFPQVTPENDVLGRLLCFAMRMCQLRIEKNSNLTAH